MEDDLTESILKKWKEQKNFIRYLDGDTLKEDNLQIVKIKEAMNNIEWKVDWDFNLTWEEINLVKNSTWRNKIEKKITNF